MKPKKAKFIWDNLLGLILAVLIVIILVTFFFRVLTPVYDPVKETTKSYFNQLENAIDKAEKQGVSSFSAFVLPYSEIKYFLVYFKDRQLFKDYHFYSKESYGEIINVYYTDFFLRRFSKDTVCICSINYEDSKRIFTKPKPGENFPEGVQGYFSQSSCIKCLDLEHPAEFSRTDEGKTIFDLSKNSFLIRKLEQKYQIEIIDK